MHRRTGLVHGESSLATGFGMQVSKSFVHVPALLVLASARAQSEALITLLTSFGVHSTWIAEQTHQVDAVLPIERASNPI